MTWYNPLTWFEAGVPDPKYGKFRVEIAPLLKSVNDLSDKLMKESVRIEAYAKQSAVKNELQSLSSLIRSFPRIYSDLLRLLNKLPEEITNKNVEKHISRLKTELGAAVGEYKTQYEEFKRQHGELRSKVPRGLFKETRTYLGQILTLLEITIAKKIKKHFP